jgi:transcriptional regulator with XRE-family HTH domain
VSRPACRITGLDVIDLRRALGLSVTTFASVLGVNVSTIYRWETRGNAGLPIEPLQIAILMATRDLVARGDGVAIGKELELALLLRGPLYALYVLLRRIYPPEPVLTPESAAVGAHSEGCREDEP